MTSGPDLGAYRFSALIFDCDGTLADTAPVHYLAFSTAIRTCGAEMPRSWYYARLGVSRRELFEEFMTEHGIMFDADVVAAHSMRVYQDNIHQVKEVKLVGQLARAQAERVPMAVASGGQRVAVEATLRAIGLRPLFQHVVTVEDVGRGKPSPDLFLLAAGRMEVEPTVCLVFEDSDEGLEAAHRAGMAAIDVRPLLGRDR